MKLQTLIIRAHFHIKEQYINVPAYAKLACELGDLNNHCGISEQFKIKLHIFWRLQGRNIEDNLELNCINFSQKKSSKINEWYTSEHWQSHQTIEYIQVHHNYSYHIEVFIDTHKGTLLCQTTAHVQNRVSSSWWHHGEGDRCHFGLSSTFHTGGAHASPDGGLTQVTPMKAKRVSPDKSHTPHVSLTDWHITN